MPIFMPVFLDLYPRGKIYKLLLRLIGIYRVISGTVLAFFKPFLYYKFK